MNTYQSPVVLSSEKDITLYPQGGVEIIAVVTMFALLIALGALAICVAAGYRGFAFWRKVNNTRVLVYCVK
jgi:hypothetical protein